MENTKSMYQLRQEFLKKQKTNAATMGLEHQAKKLDSISSTKTPKPIVYDRNIISTVRAGRGEKYSKFKEYSLDRERNQLLKHQLKALEQKAVSDDKDAKQKEKQGHVSGIDKLKQQKEKERYVDYLKQKADPKILETKRRPGEYFVQNGISTSSVVLG